MLVYRTISKLDPNITVNIRYVQQVKLLNIGDKCSLRPLGGDGKAIGTIGHTNKYDHVNYFNTLSEFTSWSTDQSINWLHFGGAGKIQIMTILSNKNYYEDVSPWTHFISEKEILVTGKIEEVKRIR